MCITEGMPPYFLILLCEKRKKSNRNFAKNHMGDGRIVSILMKTMR